MKRSSLIFTAPRQIEVVEERLPPPAEGEVLVQSRLSAISPGTERLVYDGLAPTDLPADENLPGLQGDLSFPLRYGYSTVGHVRALGPGVSEGWLGRPVFAFHPHTSAFTIKSSALIDLPDDLALEDAVFLPNMETAVNFLHDGAPLLGDRVLVLGQGIVGLLTTSLLERTSLSKLVTLDPVEARRTLSTQAGADLSLDPGENGDLEELEKLLSNGSQPGADLIYELSGNPQALNLAIRFAGFAGRIVIGSWYGNKHSGDLDLGADFHRRRLRLMSSQVSTIAPSLRGRWDKSRRIGLVLDLLKEVRPSKWVTHRFPLTEADAAYKQLGNPQALQVLLTYATDGAGE
jgi:2-desacetyl-2-hydroxyethyl bacteriochlorophyllide A dehydrogenase